MTLEDLQYIFNPQVTEGTTKLYFMLEDDGYTTIERHDANNIESLLPMLDCFQYAGCTARMPRFVK